MIKSADTYTGAERWGGSKIIRKLYKTLIIVVKNTFSYFVGMEYNMGI